MARYDSDGKMVDNFALGWFVGWWRSYILHSVLYCALLCCAVIYAATPLKLCAQVHVQTERKGFFDKIRPDSTEKGGGHGVTDDAMAAMAMAAMTQELDQMKRSLQNEVFFFLSGC